MTITKKLLQHTAKNAVEVILVEGGSVVMTVQHLEQLSVTITIIISTYSRVVIVVTTKLSHCKLFLLILFQTNPYKARDVLYWSWEGP